MLKALKEIILKNGKIILFATWKKVVQPLGVFLKTLGKWGKDMMIDVGHAIKTFAGKTMTSFRIFIGNLVVVVPKLLSAMKQFVVNLALVLSNFFGKVKNSWVVFVT